MWRIDTGVTSLSARQRGVIVGAGTLLWTVAAVFVVPPLALVPVELGLGAGLGGWSGASGAVVGSLSGVVVGGLVGGLAGLILAPAMWGDRADGLVGVGGFGVGAGVGAGLGRALGAGFGTALAIGLVEPQE